MIAGVAAFGIVHVARKWLGAERSADPSRVRIATVTRGKLVRDLVADGRVVAARSPTLYAIAAGTVDLAVQPGDAVVKDQVLATIASPELESRLAQEQATLAGLEAEVGKAGLEVERGSSGAHKEIDQAEIDLTAAKRELERDQQVYDQGALPELELRRAEDAVKKAEIALAHAKEDARLTGKGLSFDLGTKKQALDRQRSVVAELQRQVGALVIKSPVDGQVGQVLVAQRAAVAANAPIVSVIDLSAFELEIKVPDSFARDLAIGMGAEIRTGASTVAGKIRSVAPEVVDGHVASRIEFVGARPAGLRQNQRLTARILIEERNDVVQVERGPFLETGGGNVAYVVEDGVAERRAIRTGAISLDAVEILSGAKPGDRIVVSGSDTFANAERVRISE
ncbi:MAG TPA: HlyD family efflux transporter periplasmic adaptor subunit [Kofleriaceae bacterium]|nr:HlyD family efflux transporter periplasmic adaptor subunit [Kofleriaceae bacterium]